MNLRRQRRDGNDERYRGRRAVKFLATLVAGVGLILAGWLSASPVLAQEAAGASLARHLGCFACHDDSRGSLAPSLNGVGSRLSRDKLRVVLNQPRKLYPGAKMPSYAYLPAGERRALLDFLVSLK
jgi:cytochrome c2